MREKKYKILKTKKKNILSTCFSGCRGKVLFLPVFLCLSMMTLSAQPMPTGNPQVRHMGNLAKEVGGTSTLFFFDGRLWTCNDHGRLRLYALDTLTGKVETTVDLKVNVYDLEEVAQDEDYLYFGDFGDNRGVRNDLRILRLAKDDFRQQRYRFDTIAFTYPDRDGGTLARNFDCEAFAAVNDSLYLFTKQWISQGTTCYVLSKLPRRQVARRGCSFDTRGLVTGACYHPSSRRMVLLGYSLLLQPFVYIVEDFVGQSDSGGRRVTLDSPLGTQAEGIASSDGIIFFFTNETFEMSIISRKASLQKVDLGGFTRER